MNSSDALYFLLTGDTFDGKKACETRLVYEAVPRAQLRERTEGARQEADGEEPACGWARSSSLFGGSRR